MASSTLVDSTTGDTSALSKLPSGYTASVVLPGGVRRTKAISTPADAKMRSRGNQQTPESIPAADVAFPIREVYFLHSNNKPMVNVLNQGKELPHTACDVALYLSTKATPPGAVHQRAAAAPRSISTPADAKMRSRGNQPASTRRRRAFRPCWNYVRTCLTRGGSCRIHHAT